LTFPGARSRRWGAAMAAVTLEAVKFRKALRGPPSLITKRGAGVIADHRLH